MRKTRRSANARAKPTARAGFCGVLKRGIMAGKQDVKDDERKIAARERLLLSLAPDGASRLILNDPQVLLMDKDAKVLWKAP